MTGSSPCLNLLSKASRQWRDKVCLRALYFIPNAVQAAFSIIRGLGGLVTIPSFLNSYESCVVADALSQDPGIDMKARLDAECVAPSPALDWTHLINAHPPSSWIDWIRHAMNKFSIYRLVRGIVYYLRTFSALFDAYAALAWVCVIS